MHERNAAGTAVASNKGYWWHLRYRGQCFATDLCNPIGRTGKPAALQWHQVAEWSREPGILAGYRPDECTWSECLASLFSANNETFNVWSHAVAAVYFVWRTVHLAGCIDQSDDDHYCRALVVYMITACLYPAMSAVAHGLSALSRRARTVCFFMDYAAISSYSFGCALLYRAYALPEDWMTPGWTDIYLGTAVCLSLASTALTCSSRTLETDVVRQRIMRLAAFTLPYIWDTIPLVDRLASCWWWYQVPTDDRHSSCLTDRGLLGARLHAVQIFVALLASFAYASHLPERIFPGTFDFVGHSHNLLHVCGALATFFQLEAGLVDSSARRERLTTAGLALDDAWWTFSVPALVLIGHATILTWFARYVCTHPEAEQQQQQRQQRPKCH